MPLCFLWAFALPALAFRIILSRWGVRPSLPPAYRIEIRTPTGFPRSTPSRYDWVGLPLNPGACGVHPPDHRFRRSHRALPREALEPPLHAICAVRG